MKKLLLMTIFLISGKWCFAGEHDYFESLISRPTLWKSFSLRDQEQLERYKAADSKPTEVIYIYPEDPDARMQDAAKIKIPPYQFYTTLAEPLDDLSAQVVLVSSRNGASYDVGRQISIDDEVMKIVSLNGVVLTVVRGEFGTIPQLHSVGSPVGLSYNSLANQVWLPLGTTDGNSYLFTWDAWYGKELSRPSSGLTNWKTFQIDAPRALGDRGTIWFEVRTRFDLAPSTTDIAVVDARGYSYPFGPNVTDGQPLSPSVGTFIIKPETWVRYWVEMEQQALDWDLMSLWVADENNDPVKIIDRLQFEAYDGANRFRIEYNTSQDRHSVNRGPLTSYVRNFAILKNEESVDSLLMRPSSLTPPLIEPPVEEPIEPPVEEPVPVPDEVIELQLNIKINPSSKSYAIDIAPLGETE